MLTSIGTVVGTSGKQNLWVTEDEEKINVSSGLLSLNRGEQNE